MATWTAYQEPTRNESVSVGTSSVVVSTARQGGEERKALVIRNSSPNAADIITLNLGANQATAGAGIILRQNDTYTESTDGGFRCWQGTITGICATANGTLSVFER